MNLLDYKLQVAGAEGAAELHELRGTAQLDPQLNDAQKKHIAEAISRRFSALNAAVVNQTPRASRPGWSAPVRIPTAIRTH